MVDFTSTQEGIDEPTKRSARLLAAVIAQALKDLAITPTPNERKYERNILTDCYESLRFFFDEDSPFKHYAYMVGIDPKSFVYHLEHRAIEYGGPENTKLPYLAERDLRAMRVRINWYKIERAQAKNARPE